jgi:flagellar hook-associated protein 2
MTVGSIGGTYGLSGSGMDIDSIVKSLMTGQQAKTDALLQKKTVLQWQKTAYNTVYDDISNFRATVFNYKMQGTLSPNKVSSSNTSVATVSASADAAEVNHSLVVAQLASGANLTSTANISTGDKSTLASQMGVLNSFTLNIGNGSTNKSITIKPTDSVNNVVSAINNAGVNVKASYDSTLDRFFISTTNMGSSTGINITTTSISPNASVRDDGGLFIEGLHLYTSAPISSSTSDGTNTTTTTTFSSAPGRDAVFKLDGVSLTEASNTFGISGVTYNLTGVSTGAAMLSPGVMDMTVGQTTSVSVTNDVDKAVASIQSLVDSYNKILTEVNGMVNETRYKDYPPLTDAQKTAMKESDITAWEAKAKSGMLHNDSTLSNLVNTMRSAFSSPVSTGTYNSGASIGITTGNYTEGGKLYLDTDKLRTALNAKPDVLSQLFGASGENLEGTTVYSDQGISGRLYDGIKATMDQLAQTAGTNGTAQYDTNSSYAKRITDYSLQISYQADRFDVVEAAYYKKFNAMELALKQLSSQSSWLQSVGTTL